MVEHALWEGLSTGVGAQVSGEAERLVDGKVCPYDEHRGTSHLLFLEDMTTSAIKHTVDTTHGDFGAL